MVASDHLNAENEKLRQQYQKRIDSGATIAQIAREKGIPASTIRLILRRLGVDLATRASKDKRYLAGYCAPKYLDTKETQSETREEKINRIAAKEEIELGSENDIEKKLVILLRVLVTRHPNTYIAQQFGVSETTIRKWTRSNDISTVGNGNWRKVEVGTAKIEDILDSKDPERNKR